jgi:hypothetical protein
VASKSVVGKSHNRSQGQRDAVLIPDPSTSEFAEIALKWEQATLTKTARSRSYFKKKGR